MRLLLFFVLLFVIYEHNLLFQLMHFVPKNDFLLLSIIKNKKQGQNNNNPTSCKVLSSGSRLRK